ncbi:MAG: O-antigen ligase family protein [Brachybacterium sp.]|uniref:O-antigen ligase family protein n=1 Tax=Brachybacterium sp. TaxID=1891286 RepID=UPI002649418D|nr:O-antigen ligase family protein [Brachybacterium sp.]MDN5686076.1 O-antigen ligase family protein [Brachybacterium sp.]
MRNAPPAGDARSARPHPDAPLSRPEKIPVLYREPLEILLLGLLVVLGLTLNHSSVILGLNLSLADPIVAALTIVLLVARRMWIPAAPLIFFLLLSVQLLAVTILLFPGWTARDLPIAATIEEYAKLVASFLCLLVGVQVVRLGLATVLLRTFVVGSVAVSSIAVASIAIPGLQSLDALFLGGFRFQGLTNDPNNFAVMTIAAIAILWFDPGIRPHLRVAASAILISGVLLSASKTGAITLVLLVIWRAFGIRTPHVDDAGSRSRRLLAAVSALALAVVVLFIAPSTGVGGTFAELTSRVPALDRTSTLLTSFDTAIAGGGSDREAAWTTALALIWFTPALGVGVGNYLAMAQELTGTELLAHNTYLQILAEWGVPLALVFFLWVARAALLRPAGATHHALWAASSTALLVMLTGSIGLSLNNSRLLWVLLGMTVATHLLSRAERRTGSDVRDDASPTPPPLSPAEPGSRASSGSHRRPDPATIWPRVATYRRPPPTISRTP